MRTKNELNNVYGRLTVIARAGTHTNGGAQWQCRCTCGNLKLSTGSQLRSGHTKSCGCLARETTAKTGRKQGRIMAARSKNGLHYISAVEEAAWDDAVDPDTVYLEEFGL